MIALAQISGTAFVSGELALSLLSETESAEGTECTPWKLSICSCRHSGDLPCGNRCLAAAPEAPARN